MRRHTMLATLAVLTLPSAAAPASAELIGQTAELAFFEGSWACTGRRFATPQISEQQFTANCDFTSAAGGAWLETRYAEELTAANPVPLTIQEFWGFDAPAGQYRTRRVSNFSTAGTFEASGWVDQEWTWTTDKFPMGDIAPPMRALYRRIGPDKFAVQPAIQDSGGKWQAFAEFSCDRK